jgi:hypothetical protein
MSTIPTVTMQDLELEHAELLPARETLFGIDPGGPMRFYGGPVPVDLGGPVHFVGGPVSPWGMTPNAA